MVLPHLSVVWRACFRGNEIGFAMQKEIEKPAQEIAESKIPAQLKGLFPEPPFLDGEDPNLYRNLLAAVIDERQPKTVTDWIAVHDLVTKLREEQVFRRASNALIRGGMITAVAHFLEEVTTGPQFKTSKQVAVGYFSKDPKERKEVRLRRDNQDGNPATIRMRMRRCRGDEGRA